MNDEVNILYRVVFYQNDKLYEIYANFVSEESLVGFLEIEDLVFKDSQSEVVVDPGEEKLRQEFKDVKRCYIPIHLVQRIDEVLKEGIATIKDTNSTSNNVSPFPGVKLRSTKPEESDD